MYVLPIYIYILLYLKDILTFVFTIIYIHYLKKNFMVPYTLYIYKFIPYYVYIISHIFYLA